MTEIKLPPLPYPQIPGNDYTAKDMHEYATAAIEADRQSRDCGQCVPLSTDGKSVFIDGVGDVPLGFGGQARGEPVAWWKVFEGQVSVVPASTFNADDAIALGWRSLVFSDAAPQPQQIPENIKQAIQKAYGHLWMVNNEPGTPNQYSPEQAVYKARQLLLGVLTKEERGDGINSAMLEAAPANGEKS